MSSQEIIEYLRTFLSDSNYEAGDLKYNQEKVGLGTIAEVHSEGNKEGGGEYSEIVYHFVDYDVYLRITGFYTSYNGTDWNDNWTEVFPQEKTITVYE
jgi:hypothetical protein